MYVCMYACMHICIYSMYRNKYMYIHTWFYRAHLCMLYYMHIRIYICQKRTEKHVFVFDHILSEKHLRCLDKNCSRVKFKTIHPSSRPNSCFPVAYCSASPQGIPSKYIRAHAFAWRDGREQTRVRELKSRSQKAFVFSFYWGAEHAGLCLKFNIEKEIDSKKMST